LMEMSAKFVSFSFIRLTSSAWHSSIDQYFVLILHSVL
jgi:hypothetical protein